MGVSKVRVTVASRNELYLVIKSTTYNSLRHRESASLAIPGHGGDAAGRQQVNHVARADFGRTEVDGVLAAIGKVAVALTARDGDDDGSQTPKAVLEAARARSLYGKLTILTLVPCMGELTLLIGLVMFSQLTYPVCGDF